MQYCVKHKVGPDTKKVRNVHYKGYHSTFTLLLKLHTLAYHHTIHLLSLPPCGRIYVYL